MWTEYYAMAAACRWCGLTLHQRTPEGRWAVGKIGGLGDDPQCPEAPNPDDGPMPDHRPGTPVVLNPEWKG